MMRAIQTLNLADYTLDFVYTCLSGIVRWVDYISLLARQDKWVGGGE